MLLAAAQTHAQAATATIGGTVYEDLNGDSRLNDGAPRAGVNVRAYADTNNDNVLNTGDAHIADAVTDTNGRYTFSVTPAANGTRYFVAVDSRSITPSAGFNAGSALGDVWAEQTYGDDWKTAGLSLGSRYGGRDVEVTGSNRSDKYKVSSTSVSNGIYRHLAFVDVTNGSIANLDWGFSFNVITNARAGAADDDDPNANRTVQGSLRQFMQNANAVAGSNAMRFVPTLAGRGVNGTWRVEVSSVLPPLTDNETTLDGTTYQAVDGVTVREQNVGQYGTGGTVGVDLLPLQQVNKPELEIKNLRSTAVVEVGLDVQGSNVTIRNLAIYGFGSTPNSATSANIRAGSNAYGVLIERNVIGALASEWKAPEPTVRGNGDNLRLSGSGTIQHNLIGFSAGSGVANEDDAGSWTIDNNELRGNTLSGVRANANAIVVANLIADNGDTGTTMLGGVAEQNTVFNNGRQAATESDAGVRMDGLYGVVQQNVIRANHGAGVLVQAAANYAFISRNSISANGTITDTVGAAATGQIGIDLLAAADNQQRGAAPFITRNDTGDNDVGGNGLRNAPVLERAAINNGTLTISGFAAPTAQIEFFVAAPDASGFGEGQTYLLTLEEGSIDDADPSTGSYAGTINGLDQGSDTTSRFLFNIPTPAGVAAGAKLTATATVFTDGATSEFSGVVTVGPSPTAITLSSFTATKQDDGIVLQWETATEQNTAGFYLWRSTTPNRADAVRVTEDLIPGKGVGANGATYRWKDTGVQPGKMYVYWLQEIETEGAAGEYGPVYGGASHTLLPMIR